MNCIMAISNKIILMGNEDGNFIIVDMIPGKEMPNSS